MVLVYNGRSFITNGFNRKFINYGTNIITKANYTIRQGN